MKFKTLVLAMASLPAASFAADENLLDEVVVTATRTAQTADETLQSVTVITRKEIEQSQARDVMGLLDAYAGINVARTGGAGKNTSIYLRGTNAKHVLVLVDGVRAASATLGEYDWNALSPDQIERIEIVRGPRASLYGSDAVGGVIQIFTRRAKGPQIHLTAGSNATRGISAATGGGDVWRYSIEAGRETTDGIPTYSTGTTAYGFDRNHAALGLDGDVSKTLSIALRLSREWGRNELDPYTGNNDYTNQTSSLRVMHQTSEQWKQTLTLGHQLDRSESFSPYIPSTIETSRQSLAWQHDLTLATGLLSLGVDHWNDHASKDRSGVIDQSIENTGVFLQYQVEALGSDWQVGARRDEHDVFGGRNTWNLGWGHDLGGGFRLTAAYGTAFKAPTVNDFFWPYSSSQSGTYSYGGVYYSDTYITQGNAALRPETSKSAEIGLRYRGQGLDMAANLYETRIRDLIEWAYDWIPGGGSGTSGDPYLATYDYYPANVSSARIRGLELTGGTTLAGWDVNVAYTRLLATNLDTGLQLDRRPTNGLLLKAVRSFGPHRVRLEAEGYSQRMDAKGKRTIDGYGLLHAGYEYSIAKSVSLGVRMENLLDKEYALARTSSRFYAAEGRSVFFTLRYDPK